MASYRIGQLARRYGLSRATLLYYHRLGLLQPSQRGANQYRYYSEADVARLEQIVRYRQAGLSLEQIQQMLAQQHDCPDHPGHQLLHQRLRQIQEDLQLLQQQQQQVLHLLGAEHSASALLDKAAWVAILQACGMDEAAMWRWHQAFEQQLPEQHQAFLQRLGIDAEEIARIRRKSLQP